ncbi:MAG: dTMP kinase [Chloroflexi bacterium]|nr:dTMP kinase [Chloroflexota bacterium]
MSSRAHPGLFLTFEGPEGSGKTSQMRALAEFLRGQGYPVLTTREPGGTSIGLHIRDLLLDPRFGDMTPRAEVLLFLADRAQHVDQVIRPALERGDIVLCDRYADSTLAYQGYGHRHFDLEQLRALIEFATGGLWPDRTFLLDIAPEEGLARNGAQRDRLEGHALDFHRRVRQGYLEMAAAEPERWVVLDATQHWDAIQDQLRRHVQALIQARRAAQVPPRG